MRCVGHIVTQGADKNPHPIPTGKQTVRQLIGQGQGVTNIEITDGNIKLIVRIARIYGVTYALKYEVSWEHPR